MGIMIEYKGHSCFRVVKDGYVIAFDPYAPYVPGYPELTLSAHRVICSHDHQDHNYQEAVSRIDDGKENPFRITQFDVPHDEAGGTLRGRNMITVLETDAEKVVHFGDVGCMPDEEILNAVRGADAVMIPVGGFYTIGPDEADQLAKSIEARVVIPMHYRIGEVGFPVLEELQAFLDLRNDAVVYDSNQLDLTEAQKKQTAVLQY